MKTNLIRIQRPLSRALVILAVLLVAMSMAPSVRAASATWLASPTDGNWEATGSENNWSTGAATWPGGNSTSSTDTATFNSASSQTTITINGAAWNVKYVTFDTTNCAAYTINSTESAAAARWTGGGAVTISSTVTQPQVFSGSQYRLHSGGGLSLVNNSTNATAVLTYSAGIKANNSTSTNLLDQAVNLQGSNPGNNSFSGVIADYSTSAGQIAAVTKSGAGTWYLKGNNTYSGPTIITGGLLVLSGSGAMNATTNVIISGTGTALRFTNAMNLTAANSYMIVTNSGTLSITNTAFQTPVTVANLVVSNATLRLGVNGATPFNNIVVTSALTAGPGITLAIDQAKNVVASTTFTLISYTGSDPDPADFTVTVPAGYSAGPVTVGGGLVTVTVNPPAAASSVVWVGATNSVLVSNWDTTTKNWVDAATLTFPQAYANPDTVSFDDTASNSTVTLTAAFTPFNVNVANYTLNYTFNGSGKISGDYGLTKQGNASLTLAETGGDDFTGGITVNGGTLILDNANSAISGGLTVAGGATMQIGNNDGNGALPAGSVAVDGALIFSRSVNTIVSTAISGYGSLTQNGNGTLTLNNTNSYVASTIISKGALALTGAGSISNSAQVVVSNATFDVSGVPARTTLLGDLNITNATLNVGPTNLQTPISVISFEVDGITSHSNLVNVLSLPPIASYPATITLIKSAYQISLAGGNFNFALGSLPAASPAYAGSLSESGDNTAVLLTLTSGPVGVRPSVTWTGIDYVSVTTNWSDRLNWQLPGAPAAVDNVLFDGTTTVGDSVTVNNVVNNNFTIASLTYNQTSSGAWHVTDIPPGATLTVSGATTIGGMTGDGVRTSVAMTDAGTLLLNGNLTIGNNGSSGSDTGTILDLSGLSNFVCNASGGSVTMGTGNRSAANFNLAGASNSITVGTFNANVSSSSSSVSGTLTLGAETNILSVGTFNIAGQRSSCTVQFPASATTGGLRLRGTGGTDADRTTMTLGNRQATGSGGTTTGTLALNGHPVDMKLGTLIVGQASGVTANTGTGNFQFDTGTVDATTINMAICSVAGAAANGTITVGANGKLIVGTGGISLANQTAGTSTGNIFLNGGTLICSNSIVKTTALGTGNISISDGTLNMLSGTIGIPGAPIDYLALSDNGTLDTKIQINVTPGVTNIVATAVSASGLTTININSIAGVIGTAQVPIISYNNGASPFGGLVLGAVPAGYTGGSLVDNTTSQTIDLLITSPAPLVWVGAVGSTLNSSWNTSTLNWLKGATPSAYVDVDFVQFDDTASNGVVTLTTSVSPPGIIVNDNALNYTFNGTGKISGTGSLLKQGAGTLILDNAGSNDFSGGINITEGALQIGNNDTNGTLPLGSILDNGTLIFSRTNNLLVVNGISGSGGVSQINSNIVTLAGTNTYSGATVISNGTLRVNNTNALGSWSGAAVTITNGGTLDIGGFSTAIVQANPDFGAKQFYVAGAGVGGNGAIVNNGTNQQLGAFQAITLTANATFGGTARWDMRNGTPLLDLQGFKLTKTGAIQSSLVAITVTSGDIDINQGTLSFEVTSAVNGTGTITVNSGGTLGHYRLAGGAITRPLVLNGGAISNLATTGAGSVNDAPITLNANSLLGGSTSPTNAVTLNGVISETGGSFGLTKLGAGGFILTAANTYSGSTLVNSGILSLTGDGSIANSSTIMVASNATLDVSARNDGTLTLNANQTLTGSGAVTGIVTATSGSIVAPGSPASVGVLTVSGNITLGGTNVMKLNQSSATNDVLKAGGIAFGGTLSLSFTPGTLIGGSSFKLFNAASYTGNFDSIVPATPGTYLKWNTNNLATSGILAVVSVPRPGISSSAATSDGLVISGTNGPANATYYVLSSTNVTAPLDTWRPVSTNVFDASGNFKLTNAINHAVPDQFYLLQVPQ